MAFQIAYVFRAIDKFSKVTDKFYKAVDKIDKKVQKTTAKLEKFQKVGAKSFTKVSKTTDKAANKVERFTSKQKKATLAMRSMSAVTGNLKFRIASLLVTLGMTGFGMQKLIDRGKEIESAFINLSALTGITGKDLEFLREKSHQFARVFGIEAKDIFVAFKRVAGLKPELIKDVEALADLTKWTLILDAPIGQLEKTARALTVALNIYGKSAKNAAEFSNILAAGARFGSAEVNEMALSFLKAGTVAETVASIPFLDLMVMIEAVAQKGLLAQVSGTGLRTVIIRLQKAGFDFKKLGIDGVFAKIKKQLDETTDSTKKGQLAFDLFGMRQQAVGLALANNVELMKLLKKEMSGTNIAVETADKALSAYEKRVISIWSIWDDELSKIFENIKPYLLEFQLQLAVLFKSVARGVQLAPLINAFLRLGSMILVVANALILLQRIILLPIVTAVSGLKAGLEEWKDIQSTAKSLIMGVPTLETVLTPEEAGEKSGKPGAAGKVSIDLNLRGNTEAVASVHGATEGEVDLNIGKNLGFIG